MKKLRLDLDTLAVESFTTARDANARDGTVEARVAASYDGCPYYTMSDYTAQLNCTAARDCTAFRGCTGITYCYWTP